MLHKPRRCHINAGTGALFDDFAVDIPVRTVVDRLSPSASRLYLHVVFTSVAFRMFLWRDFMVLHVLDIVCLYFQTRS